tara:strand:- start:1014 stop:1691 length:678 start_codon:yes stop_codon:yes gene_type:complete
MKDTLEKIKTLLSIDNTESKEVKMYAEMILEDGRVVATEDEEFAIGSAVFVVNDDGEASALASGSYTMENGAKITIDDDGKISDMGEEAEEVEAEDKEEMEESDEMDLKKSYDELAKRVDELEKKMYKKEDMSEETEETVEETVEETAEEISEEEKIEMSKDMVNSLVEEVEHLKAKLVEFEKEPGAKGFKHNPEPISKNKAVNMSKLSTQERVAYFMNKLNNNN